MADENKNDVKAGGLEDARNQLNRERREAPKPGAANEPADPPEGDDNGEDEFDAKAVAEENARLRAALRKANKDSERNRRKAREREPEGEDGEEPDEASELRLELYERDAADLLRDAKLRGAKGAATTREARRYVRLLESVHPDEVEDAIEDLKEAQPHLFGSDKDDKGDDGEPRARRRRSPGRGPGGAEPNQPRRAKDNLSATSRLMLRGSRRTSGW